MSVRVTLNCKVKPGKFTALLPFLEKNLPNVRAFSGNMQVRVLSDENNDEILIDEVWLSKEKHQAYLAFIDGNGVLGEFSAFFLAPPDIKYFSELDV